MDSNVYDFSAIVSPCLKCGFDGDRHVCSKRCGALNSYRAMIKFLPPAEPHQSLLGEGNKRVMPVSVSALEQKY